MTKLRPSHTTPADGNVFEDLGFPQAEAKVMLEKTKLVSALRTMIEDAGWTRAKAAKAMGMTSERLVGLFHGDHDDISVSQLLDFLTRLGCDIQVTINPPAKPIAPTTRVRQGHYQVVHAD